MRLRTNFVAVSVFLLLLGSAYAEPSIDSSGMDASAPTGCWYTRGGCAARTCAARSCDLDAELSTAWTFKPRKSTAGPIEEGPYVWGRRVVLVTRPNPAARALHVVDLFTGRPLAPPKTIKTKLPLCLSIWRDEILIRERADRLVLYGLAGRSWIHRRKYSHDVAFTDALLYDGDVYAAALDGVLAYKRGRATQRWKCEGAFRGHLALRDGCVYALAYVEGGDAFLTAIDARSGRTAARTYVGSRADGRIPGPTADMAVQVMDGHVLVRHKADVVARPLGRGDTVFIRTKVGRAGQVEFLGGDVPQLGPVAATPGGYVGMRTGGQGAGLVHGVASDKGAYEVHPLANESFHPEFVDGNAAIASAGDIVFVGARAFSVEDYRVLGCGDERAGTRIVPVGDTFLALRNGVALEALRSAHHVQPAPVFFGAWRERDSAGENSVKGTVLLTTGERGKGDVSLDAQRNVVRLVEGPKKKSSLQLVDIDLVLDATRQPLYMRCLPDAPELLERVVRQGFVGDWIQLCRDAAKGFDPDRLKVLVDLAAAHGASDKQLASHRKRVATWRSKARKPKKSVCDGVDAKADALRAEVSQSVVDALAAVAMDPRWNVRAPFLAATLDLEPDHVEASSAIQKTVPKGIPMGEEFDARAWISLHDVLDGKQVKLVEPPEEGARKLTRFEREVGAARHFWRDDVVGLEGGPLLLVTPLVNSARITHCFALGSLLESALDQMFSEGDTVDRTRDPLVIQLFAEPEYFRKVALHGMPSEELGQILESMGGCYFRSEDVTRIYLSADTDAYARATRRLVEELTEHWMMNRCPLYATKDRRLSSDSPGLCLHLGLPGFLANFDWDLQGRTWGTLDPRCASLDILANAKSGQLIPWSSVFATSSKSASALRSNERIEIPMQWRLGTVCVTNTQTIYQWQAVAACTYLYHQGGNMRRGLLASMRDFYTGELGTGDDWVKKHFGISSEQLGGRIVAWARDVQSGKVKVPSTRETASR